MTYAGNPNGAKQLWSKWTFSVHEVGKHVEKPEVELNAARWLVKGFGSAGRMRVLQVPFGWKIECLIEGPTAHDRQYVQSVRVQFQRRFVESGWGPFSWGSVTVRVLAGDVEDGKPRAQMIEMPFIFSERVG